MRVFLALALLLWAAIDAHHTPGHSLKTIFPRGKTNQYEFMLNTTAGIPGMTSQLAKSSIRGTVIVQARSESEYLLKVDSVKVSRPEAGTPTDEEDLSYSRDGSLEADLKKSIQFTLEDGQVKSYTLGQNESPESQAIKRSILRHFEGKFQDQNGNEEDEFPYTYNTTKNTVVGPVQSWYAVTVSPYPEFPNDQNVYNVSKVEVYDSIEYPAVHMHHNMAKQGCPEVCKPERCNPESEQESESPKYKAGCPQGQEPHKMPVKMYSNGHYNFRKLDEENMILENLSVEEKHIASMYDQDMVIAISAEYRHKDVSNRQIEEPRDQTKYEDLVNDALPYLQETQLRREASRDASAFAEIYPIDVQRLPERVINLLNKLVDAVIENRLEKDKSHEIGEQLILIQKLMALIKHEQLEQVWSRIVDLRSYKSADQKETIRRQVMVDILPLVGTSDCLEFIKSLISQEKLSAWEAKEVLDAVPANLWKPGQTTVETLEEIRKLSQVERKPVLQTSAYLALARTMKKACLVVPSHSAINEQPEMRSRQQSSKLQGVLSYFSKRGDEEQDFMRRPSRLSRRDQKQAEQEQDCPQDLIEKFIQEVAEKLKSTQKVGEKMMYIEALTQTGNSDVLEYLRPYINGSAEEMESWAPADIDYVQTSALYALHHVVSYYPSETLEYVTPIYLNRTETPRVRIAAFSVIIRAQPSQSLLQHIARDSWEETSNEVGSYVYSAVSSFGNSSDPCMKPLKKKLQQVISQFKSYDIGVQHAQSIIATFFDQIRQFGLEKRFTYIPSNESFVPHGLYSSVMYRFDSLKDTLFQVAVNMQGISIEKLWEMIDLEVMGLRMPKDIPSHKENEIFGTAKLISRLPKEMRIAVYQKIFYSPSYIYVDEKSIRDTFEPLFEHLSNVFQYSRNTIKGHYVKVYIPSALHTFTMGQVAAFPIEFDVRHPILLSVQAELETTSQKEMSLKLIPSVHYTAHHSAQIWTPISKTAIGVYHEQKFSWTLPLEVAARWHEQNQTVTFDVKWPELHKRVVRYNSEAGTFASPLSTERLPSSLNKRPIETIPVMFRKEQVLGFPTLPKLYIAAHTEDISYGYDEVPRTWKEAAELAIKHLANPGWRRNSINATLLPERDSRTHTVRIQVGYNMEHKSRNVQSESQQLNMAPMARNTEQYEEEEQYLNEPMEESSLRFSGERDLGLPKSDAERIYKQMRQQPHIYHELIVKAYSWPNNAFAQLRVEYNHTYDKKQHTLTAHGSAQGFDRRSEQKMCLAHVAQYGYMPSEFRYKSSAYEKQRVDFYNELNLDSDCQVFRNPQLVNLASFYHKSPKQSMRSEKFDSALDEAWLLPETHEECIEDIRKGKEQSLACMKAIREKSVYNNYKIRTEWRTEIHPVLRNVTEKLNQAIKYALYSHADIDALAENKKSTVEIHAEYINQLTDSPILNIQVQTPQETVHYHKVDASYFTPLSSIHDANEIALHELTNNTYPATCTLMKEYVMTFDQKDFKLPEDSCTYILASHCEQKKKFAVLAKNLQGSETELTVYLEEHEIVLHPSRREAYEIEFNRQKYQVDKKSPIVLNEEAGIYAHVVPVGNEKLNLVLRSRAGVKIAFDGETAKVQVHPLYKGKLCGLCSEFDGEVTREFRGVDQCLYVDSEDFAHSAVTDANVCRVRTTPRFPRLCPNNRNYRTQSQDYEDERNDQEIRPKLRTVHVQKGNMICFSTQPAYMCPEEVETRETETQVLDFHCLPKYDATTRKLVAESKHRILRELASKSVDFSDSIATAQSCEQQ